MRQTLAALLVPLALSAKVPVIHTCAKLVSPGLCELALVQTKNLHFPTRRAVGIPLHPSLRATMIIGPVDGFYTLNAITPLTPEAIVAWYRAKLPTWKTKKMAYLTFLAPKADWTAVETHHLRSIGVMPCHHGRLRAFTCKSVLSIVFPAAHRRRRRIRRRGSSPRGRSAR